MRKWSTNATVAGASERSASVMIPYTVCIAGTWKSSMTRLPAATSGASISAVAGNNASLSRAICRPTESEFT